MRKIICDGCGKDKSEYTRILFVPENGFPYGGLDACRECCDKIQAIITPRRTSRDHSS